MTKKRTPRLDALLDRVEAVCLNKAALARELGVSPQHIQKWITAREYEPGGEITLHLQEWAEAKEAKQNESRAGAETPARRKARITQSKYEKNDTSPPGRYGGKEQATRKKRESRNHSARGKA